MISSLEGGDWRIPELRGQEASPSVRSGFSERSCFPSFISVAVVKHSNKMRLRGGRVYLVTTPDGREVPEVSRRWSPHVHNQEQREKEHLLAPLSRLGPVFHYSGPSPRNSAVHTGVDLPTSINNEDSDPQTCHRPTWSRQFLN